VPGLIAGNENYDSADSLTLSEAFLLAEQYNPGLQASKELVKASAAAIRQARLPRNPDLSVGFEGFGGSGKYRGTSSLESKIGLSQTIITAGKQKNETNIARQQHGISELATNQQLLDLRLEVTKNFIEIFMLQNKLDLQKQKLDLSRQAFEVVNRQVIAGEISAIEEIQAKVELTREEVAYRRLQREKELAQAKITTYWNADQRSFVRVALNDTEIASLSLPEPTRMLAARYPQLAIADRLVQKTDLQLALARSEATPDIELGVAMSRSRANNDHAFEIEIEFELPLFDRRQGKRQQAKALLSQARYQQQQQYREFLTRLTTIYTQIQSLRDELRHLDNQMLPAAEKAYNEIERAFQAGERKQADLLSSRKIRVEAAMTRLELHCEILARIAEYSLITGNEAALIERATTKER
jgi:cobalt-zinc-cadmium efflux system outer membrane protein